jgi:hypothetical protein
MRAHPSAAVLALVAIMLSSAAAQADCTCRAFGRDVPLGRSVCLTTPGGPRLAVCVMVLNNTSWRISDTLCRPGDRLIVSEAAAAEPNVTHANMLRGR